MSRSSREAPCAFPRPRRRRRVARRWRVLHHDCAVSVLHVAGGFARLRRGRGPPGLRPVENCPMAAFLACDTTAWPAPIGGRRPTTKLPGGGTLTVRPPAERSRRPTRQERHGRTRGVPAVGDVHRAARVPGLAFRAAQNGSRAGATALEQATGSPAPPGADGRSGAPIPQPCFCVRPYDTTNPDSRLSRNAADTARACARPPARALRVSIFHGAPSDPRWRQSDPTPRGKPWPAANCSAWQACPHPPGLADHGRSPFRVRPGKTKTTKRPQD